MATSLLSAANSQFIKARNIMNPSKLPQVWIYVEGLDDITFWDSCLFQYKSKYDFKIKVYRIESGERKGCTADGKSHLLEQIDFSILGTNMLLAIDSDYDWIIEEYKPSKTKSSYSKLIRENNYILQTYLYSIENYKSHHSSINDIFIKSTNECPTAEICFYITKLSEAVSQLFLIHILSVELCDDVYPLSSFRNDLSRLKWDIHTHDLSINCKKFLDNKITTFSSYIEENNVRLKQLEDKFSSLGFTRGQYYLLMQGHIVWNTMAKELLQKEVHNYRIEKIKELKLHPINNERTKQIRQYCNITGISECNTFSEINSRIEQLSIDCTSVQKVTEGFRYIELDLERLFG